MPINVRFIINIEPDDYQTVINFVRGLGLDIPKTTPIIDEAGHPDTIIAKKTVEGEDGLLKIIQYRDELGRKSQIRGVSTLTDKKEAYRRALLSLAIPAAVNIGSVAGLLFQLKPGSTLTDYLLISLLPAILSFGSAVTVRFRL